MFQAFARHVLRRDAAMDRDAVALSAALTEFYRILYNEPIFMSDEAIVQLRAVCLEIGTLVMQLREASRILGKQWFNVTPKMHKVQPYRQLLKI